MSRLAGTNGFDAQTRERLSVLVALHDLGKFNLGFQAKGRPDLGTEAGHVSEALASLFELPVRNALRPVGAWGLGATGLLVSSICHHSSCPGRR